MADQIAEQMTERFLSGIVQVVLIAHEDHLVLQDRLMQRLDGRGLQIPGKLHATDFRPDVAADRADIEADGGRAGELGVTVIRNSRVCYGLKSFLIQSKVAAR